ncbi:hypothetical protein [Wolbachia pipientis]|uniref:hypothetical protein n=1 Tax=Wolbachia pipientis TaxID=955 RepID=UPI00164A77AA|nr:hypothetical protein [Wolbachia pipientis]
MSLMWSNENMATQDLTIATLAEQLNYEDLQNSSNRIYATSGRVAYIDDLPRIILL